MAMVLDSQTLSGEVAGTPGPFPPSPISAASSRILLTCLPTSLLLLWRSGLTDLLQAPRGSPGAFTLELLPLRTSKIPAGWGISFLVFSALPTGTWREEVWLS